MCVNYTNKQLGLVELVRKIIIEAYERLSLPS